MQNVIKSFIFHLLAISTPLILTSCSNSGSETPDNNINKIQLSNKYNDSSKTNITKNIKEGTLSLSTIANVKIGTGIDSVVDALTLKDNNSNKSKENFIELLNNSEATHNGFSSGENKISYSDIIIQSFLSNDIKISAEKLTSPANSISVTVTNSNNSWDIEGLNNIKFTLTVVQKTNANEKLVKLFSDNNEANKLVASDSTSNSIILTNKLNPDYEFSTSNNNDLNGIGHKSVDEIKKWLNGTADANSNVLAKDKLLELVYKNVFLENFINKKPTPSEQGKADKNDDITVLKTNILPHGILTSNTKATFTVTEDSTEQNTNSFKSKTVTITFELIDGYKWVGLSTGLENHKIVFEFTIPVPSLEQITLFKEWNQSFVLNGDEFVFENKLDENYEPIAWKTSDEVKTWFKKTTSDAQTNYDAQEADLSEESFVKLFYEKAFLNNYFTNIKPAAEYNSAAESLKLLRENIAPHEIDDKNINAKVKVEDVTPTTGTYNSSVPAGSSKKITITLTPNKGYGWAAISKFADKTKPIKFILNMDPSDAELPINNILDIVKPYENNEKKGKPVYWFESNSNDLTFKYNEATPTLKKLLTRSVFAGPESSKKVSSAAEAVGSGFQPFTWPQDATDAKKTKKESYINETFDLSNKDNFKMFTDLVIKQTFRNHYTDDANSDTNIFVSGKQMWYSNLTEDEIQKNAEHIGKQIKSSVLISISEEQGQKLVDKKLVKYDVSFRLEPKNGGNWKGLENKTPIDIDVSFVAPNYTAIKNNETSTTTPKDETPPTIPFISGTGDNQVMKFEGEIATKILGENINSTSITSKVDIAKKFSTDSNQSSENVAADKIKTDIVNNIYENITSNELVNKSTESSTAVNELFKITKNNLSFLYIDKITNKTPTEKSKEGEQNSTSYIYDKNVQLEKISIADVPVQSGQAKADSDKKYTINLTLKLNTTNKAKWYWGNWDETLTNNNLDQYPQANKNIQLSLQITIPAATPGAKK